MVFEIRNKVALITGGASGIGLSLGRQILLNEARGIVIADTNMEHGIKAQEELQKEFGANKCLFIRTDVSDYSQFEAAFQKTIENFRNIDILFNNAGVACSKFWEKEISVNLKGTVHGMLLGFDKYLTQYMQDKEAVIVNTSSIYGVDGHGGSPVYSATKSGGLSLVKAWGNPDFYDENKVRVIGICPGATSTNISDNPGRYLGDKYERLATKIRIGRVTQESDFVARETMKIIKYATNGSVWIIEDGLPGYEYIFPDRKTMRNNIIQCE